MYERDEAGGPAGYGAGDPAAERSLREQPGILDARVLTLPDSGGERRRVAYLAGPGAAAPLAAALRERLGLDLVLPVARLGEEAALAELPHWDEAALERALAALRGDAAAALLRRSRARFLARDLLVPPHGPGDPDAPAAGPTTEAPERAEIGRRLSERDALAEAPPLALPEGHPRTLAEALERAAAGPGCAICLDAEGRERRESYAALRERALAILGGLHAAGVARGDILLLDAGEAAAFMGAYWACQLGGLLPAPVALPEPGADPAAFERLAAAWQMLGRPRLVADAARARALAAHIEGLEVLDLAALEGHAPAEPCPAEDPSETAVILLTSGSTGAPKGVRQSHAAILAMAAAAGVDAWGMRRGAETFFNWMPLDHVGGCVFLVTVPVILESDQVHSPTAPILAEPLRWVELVDRYRVSVSWAPNFAFGLIADALAGADRRPWDLSCLRILANGGEAVTEGSLRDFLAVLAPCGLPGDAMRPAFGMSETCAPITQATLGHAVGPFASLGAPVAGSALRIVGEDGGLLKEGEIGELQLAGPQLFAGYHGRDDLTAAAFDGPWFRTGDVGFLAGGQLYLTGRIKDSINVNGVKFFAHEIEATAARVPGVERAGVAAAAVRPAGATTDRVAVFFGVPAAVGADDALLRSLAVSLRARLARELGLAADYLVPVAPGEIPRTGIGKVARPQLQRRFAEGAYDAAIERVSRLLGGPGHFALTLHRPQWVEKAAPRSADAAAPAVVVAGGDPLQRPAPDDLQGHAALLERLGAAGRPATLLDLRGCEAGDPGDDAAYRSLLSLARAIAALPPEKRPRQVLAATRGAVAVDPGEAVAPGPALVPGLVRSLNLELPEVRWRAVDLDEAALKALDAVLAAEDAAGAEPVAAWRADRRLVARFEAVEPAPPTAAGPRFRDALWLVAGGLGGLGRAASARLLERGARLLLVGRSAREALPPERAEALRRLEASGRVAYRALDVGDAAALTAAVEAAEAEAGAPLAGLLHLAGLGSPVALAEDDGAELPAMRRAALDGLDALAGLLATRPEARLAVAGSIVGRVGGHIVGYAAVNAAAAERAAALIAGGARLSYLAFSSWSGVGLGAGRTSEALLRADGLLPIDPDAGVAALEAALWRPECQWLVGLDAGHPLHAALVGGAPAPLLRPAAWLACDGPAEETLERRPDALGRPAWLAVGRVPEIPRLADGTADLARLASGGGGRRVAPRDETERRVAQIFGEVLGLAAPAIDDDFFVCGGSSLLATRLAAQLARRFFVELPVGAVFRHPTVEGLTRQLRDHEPQPGMVDAVAKQLALVESLSSEERTALQARLAGGPQGVAVPAQSD